MRKKFTLIFLTIIFFFLCLPLSLTAMAAEEYTYIDENGVTQTTSASAIIPCTATLSTGWYVVNAAVEITGTITVSDDAKLILVDGKKLTVTAAGNGFKPGISIVGGNSLTIYGQAGGTAVLNATGDKWSAGIGSGYYDKSTGTITINGGTVNAYDGGAAAGIGCGFYNNSTSTITINGGTVNAYGGESNAGIGGGSGENGDTITIHGGHITAIGGTIGQGIGSDNTAGANITITGDTIQATGDSGIGGRYNRGSGGVINITGGIIEATSNGYGAGIGGGMDGDGGNITISGGTVVATGGKSGAGIGGGGEGGAGIITISGGTVTAKGGGISAYGGSSGIGCGNSGEGGTVVLKGGVMFAQVGPFERNGRYAKDVGGGAQSSSDCTLEISNTAALFLKNNRCITPTTTTHTHHNVSGHVANNAVYGIPVPWGGSIGAYLRLYTLPYNANNGNGSIPSSVIQHIGTSVSVTVVR